MKVRIINGNWWYHTKIGECYDVFDYATNCYKLLPPSRLLIFKSDCIDINELRLNKLNIILKNET